jgi:hydroxypyruvate reductase
MAGAAIELLGDRIVDGVVVHPHSAGSAPTRERAWPVDIRRLAAGHPLPDEGSLMAGEAVREVACAAGSQDLFLVLLSGGASALMELPLPGVSLVALREVTRALQHAGADIEELNVVRRSLSQLKGGGLARFAAPARVVTLALSDVVGDLPEAIGSGPTVASPTGASEALAILGRRGIATAPAVKTALAAIRPSSTELVPHCAYHVIASNRLAAEAVMTEAGARGFEAKILTTRLRGEAREAGVVIGGCAASVRSDGLPLRPPACLVFGGETTVTVRGSGRGGRNQEVALGAARAIAGCRHTAMLSFATDGVDGPTTAAGALATGETLARAIALGLSAERSLDDNDSEAFFRALDDLWGTGPTGTNANDLAIALIYP